MNPPSPFHAAAVVTRGEGVDAWHAAAVAVVDGRGRVTHTRGDADLITFTRSAIKPLQALPLCLTGARDTLGIDDEELALAAASHDGGDVQRAIAGRLLVKAGARADQLLCGAHWPIGMRVAGQHPCAGEDRDPLRHNCSGKHAGFLCLACALHRGPNLRQYVRGYVAPDHPVMRAVTAALQAATDFDLATAPRGTDGCSIPTYGIPLRRLALALARVGTGVGLRPGHAQAARRLRQAVARFPLMVSGSGRFDSRVMQRLGERVFCKVGAEGVYCAALPERGLGIAIKIDDGNNARASEVVMAAAIEALLRLSDDDAAFMRTFSDATLRNWNRIEVGALRAAPPLREALARVGDAGTAVSVPSARPLT